MLTPGNICLSTESDSRRERELPFLSVVIPVRNEESHIGAVLDDLETQDYPHDRIEVLVADGNSIDGTVNVVKAFARQTSLSVRLLLNPAQLSSSGRNVGARNARGAYLIFIDGHCHIPSNTLLTDAVDLFEKTRSDCLCRPQPLTMLGNSDFQEVVAHVRSTVLGHGRDSTIYATDLEGFVNPCSSGALYRSTVFERVGYYDESFDACEDVEFNYRVFKAGLSSYFSPLLAVLYQPRTGLTCLWQQMIRYGRGRFRLIQKHPETFSLSQVVPAGFLVWLVIGGMTSSFWWRFAACFFGTLIVYLSVVLGFSSALGFRYGWRHILQAPAVYVVTHFGLGAGFLSELFVAGLGGRRCSNNFVDCASPFPCSTSKTKISTGKSAHRRWVRSG